MKINKRGYWEEMTQADIQKEHIFDKQLCDYLNLFFTRENINTIVDLGCGLGNYTKELNNSNISCDGFDGNPDTPVLTNKRCNVLDLSQAYVFKTKYDWVLSLEVGEHLPKKYEDIYIDNICNSCIEGMVVSWAIKGQGGCGHYNEQNNQHIINKIELKGFKYDNVSSNKLRDNCHLWWFKNTLMVFRKEDLN